MDTLKEVVADLLNQISEEEFKQVFEKTEDGDVFTAMFHHGFGTGLRNELNLWHDESKALRQDIWDNMNIEEQEHFNNHWRKWGGEVYQGENMHADDASSIIMHRLWDAAKEKYYG